MPKEKVKKKPEEELEEETEEEEIEEESEEEEIEEEVDAKKKKAVKAGAPKGKVQNIIGDLEKPDPDDKEEVKSYLKTIDAKLDQLLNPKKEEDEEETEDEETEEVKPKSILRKKAKKAKEPEKRVDHFGYEY